MNNTKDTPPEVIKEQMLERRRLPLGRKEFEEWSDRIIAGAMIPGGEDDPEAFINAQKFSLANMILHLGPTESHKEDAFFIHSLLKVASNQVAHAMSLECKALVQAREAAKKPKEEVVEDIHVQ